MSHPPRPGPLHFALLALVVAAMVWGALAFGAVYPWAFTPLAIGCALVGLAALAAGRADRPPLGTLAVGLAAVGLAIGLQLIPLPSTVLDRVSPEADALLRPANLAAAVSPSRLPVSIVPDRTLVGFGLFAAFALFLLGCARITSIVGALRVSVFAIGFGVLLALVGIGQDAMTANDIHPVIYGFWAPLGGRPFGPFVNRNHFAGWMLMTVPLALTGVTDALLRAFDAGRSRSRDKLRWLSSGELGVPLLLACSYLVMGLSVLLTRSRSGVMAFAAGTTLVALMVLRHQTSSRRRFVIAAAFGVLLLGSAAWAGLDTAVGKFFESDPIQSTVGGRSGAWRDTVEIIRHFPLTGTGLNTYGSAMTLYQSDSREMHYQEAHNDYLQLAAEGGLLVGLPVLFTIAVFTRDVRRRFQEAPREGTTYWLRVGAVVGLISIALQSFVEFSLQMPGNAALFAIVAGIALHRSPNLRTAPRSEPLASRRVSHAEPYQVQADQRSGR